MRSSEKYGILTYHYYETFVNYGSVLQSFALQTYLHKIGVDTEIIDYIPAHLKEANMRFPILGRDEKYTFKGLLNLLIFTIPIYKGVRKFERFLETRMKLSKNTYYPETLNNAAYDGYIIGSDTVWSIKESKGYDDGFWANKSVMKNKKNIAYSASCADVVFSEKDDDMLSERLKNFSAISMREPKNIKHIEHLWGKTIPNTIDPTFLLERSDYESLIPTERLIKQKYILIYSRQRHLPIYNFVDRLSKELGLEIVEINKDCRRLLKAKNMASAGIEDFLRLIRDAELVVTDSFHGSVFSIIFEKDFYPYIRGNCTEKVEHLMGMLGINDRIISDSNLTSKSSINYKEVKSLLSEKINLSKGYLIEALS